MAENPHGPYIAAVVVAADPDDAWIDSAETAPDGEHITLTGILTWGEERNPPLEYWPHGLLVLWSLHEGWRYAGLREDGTNDVPEDLGLPVWAAPENVAASARALLERRALLEGEYLPTASEWDNQLVINACLPWLNED